MARRKVTDPALLEALGAPQAPDLMASHAPTTGPRKVTAPAVLAALEGNGPGRGEALARGIKQGLTLDFGDEIDAFRSANASLVPEGLRTVVASLPLVGMAFGTAREAEASNPTLSEIASGQGGGWAERFKRVLASERAKNSAAKEAHKGWYVGGEIGGGLATSAIPGGAAVKGAGLASKIAAGAKTGAAMGALYGAGGSEADTLSGIASDSALGGAVGSVAGGAAPIVGAGLKRAAAPVARWLQERALESGRKALSGIGTPLAARKEIPEAVVNQALDTGAIKPFGTVTGAANRLEEQSNILGDAYGQILKELEAKGVTGPNAVVLARDIASRAAAAGKVSLGSARPRMLADMAAELPEKVNPAPFASKRLGLLQAEEIKRGLQNEARREYDKISRQFTTAGETKKEMASIFRQAIEDEVQAQAAKAPAAAAAFEPVKSRLANTLSALRVAEEGAARAARRAPPSLVPAVAVEAITGTPGAGLLPLLARLADRRVSSTVARSSRAGAKLLEALGRANLTPAQAAEAERLAAFIAASQRQGVPALVPAAAGEDQ